MAEWDNQSDNDKIEVTLTRGSLGYILIFCRNMNILEPDDSDSAADHEAWMGARIAIAEIRQELAERGVVDPTLGVEE